MHNEPTIHAPCALGITLEHYKSILLGVEVGLSGEAHTCEVPLRLPTCVDPSGEDPGSGGHRCLDEALAEDLLELGLQLEVLEAPVDGDEQLGELQLPLLGHEVEQQVWLGVVRHPHVLEEEGGCRGKEMGLWRHIHRH